MGKGIPVKLQVFEGPLDLLLHLIDKNKIDRIKKLVLNEAVGLGPLEELLADKDVSEIRVL